MNEWIETSLGAISTQRKGINYKSEDYCPDDTGHPFITIKCFQKGGGYEHTGIKFYDGESTKADHLNHGDILFSVTDLTRAGDIVGSPLRVPQFGNLAPALASMDCMRITPLDGKCTTPFLYHRLMLADVRRQMVAYAAGSTVLHLDTKKVPSIRVRIPTSVSTQKKIAIILSTIDTAIEQTEALIEKYQHIKAGLMHDIFTRGVLPNGHGQHHPDHWLALLQTTQNRMPSRAGRAASDCQKTQSRRYPHICNARPLGKIASTKTRPHARPAHRQSTSSITNKGSVWQITKTRSSSIT